MFDRSPFIAFLGLKVIEADPTQRADHHDLRMRPEFERGAGTRQFHGGPIAAFIDTVGDFARSWRCAAACRRSTCASIT